MKTKTYETRKRSKSPLRVSVRVEPKYNRKRGDKEVYCVIQFTGKWNLTTAQREVRKALAMASKHPVFLLQIDFSQLKLDGDHFRDNTTFSSAFTATSVEFWRLILKSNGTLRMKFQNERQIEAFEVFRLMQFIRDSIDLVESPVESAIAK